MTSTDEHKHFLPAWAGSLILHGMVVGLAFAFSAQIKPLVQKDLFTWDVALVEGAKPESLSKPIQPQPLPEQVAARVIPQPSSRRTVTEVAQAVNPMEQKIESPQRTTESVLPIEQKAEVPQAGEAPMERRIVDTVDPVAEAREPEAVAASTEPVVAASTPSYETAPEFSLREAVENVTPVQVAKAPASGSEVKLDDRWVGESLYRRVAELKRYPNSARMNGQEGKVILRAIIRSDGQLADVLVQKSSGHSVLDAAAIEVVKLACPLHMKHATGKPLIVVSLPIVYSLAN